LVVDDSMHARALVEAVVSRVEGLVVVGAAEDGMRALEAARRYSPDIITLDVEMPRMGGLQALPLLRRACPASSIIMASGLTTRGAQATVTALMQGATGYVTKPEMAGSFDEALEMFEPQLRPQLEELAAQRRRQRAAFSRPSPAATDRISIRGIQLPTMLSRRRASRVLAIGSSTGGPAALSTVLGALPLDLEVATVVVQHMPPEFTRALAERLDTTSRLRVREAEGGEIVRRGEVWLAPGDRHLLVERCGLDLRVVLSDGPRVNSCRPSVDVTLESLAEACQGALTVAILTGMGRDGLSGCKSVREAGGRVLVQDEHSSVVWGMPGAVAGAGLADEVVALSGMAAAILSSVDADSAARDGA
jgi:two-component system chemotaxis response regulator CheB